MLQTDGTDAEATWMLQTTSQRSEHLLLQNLNTAQCMKRPTFSSVTNIVSHTEWQLPKLSIKSVFYSLAREKNLVDGLTTQG